MMRSQFRAHLRWLTTEEGGRAQAVPLKIYRPSARFGNNDVQYICAFDDITGIDNPEWLELGSEMDANVHVAHEEGYDSKLKPRLTVGDSFEVCEGSRVVARGVVTELYR
jgi:translation elongation factor EF-Tu-like GTPase